jgi:hypothetical protein
MTPHQLGRLPITALTATTGRVLTAFFAVHGLALAPDRPRQRAAARREWFVAAVVAPLRDAVAEFDHTQIGEQDRRRQGYCKVDLAVGGVSCLTRARRSGVPEGGDSGPG